ncbi:outer membrane beta-barrel protein [Halomonas sp. HMF6819]|uniref:outer membrane beta-barrel protein n=1 Tax=Halomonas sp. HMF6819 TaxID=3373085 RepID=UPI0037A75372
MKYVVKLAAVAALWVSAGASAQSFQAGYPQAYAGTDAMAWRADVSGVDDDLTSAALRLVGGIKLDDYLAVEFHGATGGSDDIFGQKIEMDYLIGGFLKGIIPVADGARFYGLLGYSELKLSADGAGSDRDDGISFGGGAEVDINDTFALSADLMRYLSPSEYDFDALSLGLRYRF